MRSRVLSIMEEQWRPALGWTVPNARVYPWLWSWDSCFHALIWDALDDPRAVTELGSVFSAQTPSGFVPHMNYAARPDTHQEFWGISGASTIMQPPMYGHALATLAAHGRDIDHLIRPAVRAMHHLLRSRRAPCGLLRIFHPWESGIDDHPRWAAWQPTPWDRKGWYDVKGALVRSLVVVDSEATSNPAFDVCPAGFNALVAWNARQLATVSDDRVMAAEAEDLAVRLGRCWDGEIGTWVDLAPDGTRGSSVRTLDALLPVLVSDDEEPIAAVMESLAAPGGFGSPFGPAGVHQDEPAFERSGYGRGSAWPHLSYLASLSARHHGHEELSDALAAKLVAGATRSAFAEHWDALDGHGLGARPQAWTGLALLAEHGSDRSP